MQILRETKRGLSYKHLFEFLAITEIKFVLVRLDSDMRSSRKIYVVLKKVSQTSCAKRNFNLETCKITKISKFDDASNLQCISKQIILGLLCDHIHAVISALFPELWILPFHYFNLSQRQPTR